MEKRTEEFQRNGKLEELLKEINENLDGAEKELLKVRYKEYPVILIMGAPRIGSTLTMQWFANTGEFSYPTNVMSRFYMAPIIGAKIQKLLFDSEYNFRNEIIEYSHGIDYSSANGKTKGALSPNEFWYFWRRFFAYPTNTIDYISNDELERIFDIKTFINELMGVANVFNKPIMLKGMIANYNIDFMNKILPKVIFLHLKRDPYTNVASILDARKRQLGSERMWWSFKIPELTELEQINDPISQVAGQVYYINKTVEKSLHQVSDERKLEVYYEDFCSSPGKYYSLIQEKLSQQGYHISDKNFSGEKFHLTRTEKRLDIIEAYNKFVEEKTSQKI